MCVDAVRGVSAIRIEMVRVALLRHKPHTLSGAGSAHSHCLCVCVCVRADITQGILVCAWMSKLLGVAVIFFLSVV